MLELAPGWSIPEQDLRVRYVRSSGPGGQNVNKVATKVELRLSLAGTQALSPSQKRRLSSAFPSHVTQEGDFLLRGDRHRSQQRNEQEVRIRLAEMVLSVRFPPRPRRATRPSRAAKARRLGAKRARGALKGQRRPPSDD